MGLYGDRAYDLFMKGYNCSQSVAGAFYDVVDLPQDTILTMLSGFGAGFGRMREVCGAFSGATFIVSMKLGSSDPSQKSATYSHIQELAKRYSAANNGNSIICRDLLSGLSVDSSPTASARTASYYQKRPCPNLCRIMADITADYLGLDH